VKVNPDCMIFVLIGGEVLADRAASSPSPPAVGSLGSAGSSHTSRSSGRKRILEHEKAPKMHIVGINFISFAAHICTSLPGYDS